MSQLQRTVNHCDLCHHEWIPTTGVIYTHCTSGKCRSRKWNSLAVSVRKRPELNVERVVELDTEIP